MLQATFRPFTVSSIPLTSSDAVSNRSRHFNRKCLTNRTLIFARCVTGSSYVLRTTAGSDAVLNAARAPLWPRAHRTHATSEHLDDPLFQTRRGKIRQCLSRNREHFLIRTAQDRHDQVLGVALQRLLAPGAQGIGRLPRIVEEPLAFGVRFIPRLAQNCRTLPIELFVLC